MKFGSTSKNIHLGGFIRMRIINRDEFLKLPPNTIFSKFDPNVFYMPLIKLDNVGDNDFYYTPISGDLYCNILDEDEVIEGMIRKGEKAMLVFDTEYRDGLFDEDQLFAIWDKQDVKRLIQRLLLCI